MDADTVFGLYVYCADYHSGQASRLYRIMSRIELRYKPVLSDHAWKSIRGEDDCLDWEDARLVYKYLVATYEAREDAR